MILTFSYETVLKECGDDNTSVLNGAINCALKLFDVDERRKHSFWARHGQNVAGVQVLVMPA